MLGHIQYNGPISIILRAHAVNFDLKVSQRCFTIYQHELQLKLHIKMAILLMSPQAINVALTRQLNRRLAADRLCPAGYNGRPSRMLFWHSLNLFSNYNEAL